MIRTLLRATAVALVGLTLPLMANAADSATGETGEIQFCVLTGSPAACSVAADLRTKASALASPVAIYEYVRNNYDYALYHGARSGSVNTFLGGRGNDVDLSATLIAMLRSQGIPARYAVGTVRVPATQVANWLQVKDTSLAKSLLIDQGIQGVVSSTSGATATLDFEHVWVEVLVPYGQYRGLGQPVVNCATTPVSSQCHWVPLDPSFKQYKQKNSGLDPYVSQSFETNFGYVSGLNASFLNKYYNAIKNNDNAWRDKNPLAIYQEQLLAWLNTNSPGKSLQDIGDFQGVTSESSGLLPASLPYKVVGTARTYNSMADHDAVVPASESRKWGKYLNVSVVIQVTLDDQTKYPASVSIGSVLLTDIATSRLSLATETNADGSPRLVLRSGGVAVGHLFESLEPMSGFITVNGSLRTCTMELHDGDPFSIQVSMDGAVSSAPINATYPALAGGYYLVAAGGESSNWSQVHRAAQELLDSIKKYPIVFNSAEVGCLVAAGGQGCTPYVDANGGGWDSSDAKLQNSPVALDALTGGLLNVAATQYYARLRGDFEQADKLNKIKSPVVGFLGVVSSGKVAEYIDGTAFSILPAGLLIDMKGLTVGGSWRIDSPSTNSNEHYSLLGHIASSNEHEVWQALTGYDAISTVRGIQTALASGADLVDVKRNSSTDTVPSMYTPFGFGTSAPAGFTFSQNQFWDVTIANNDPSNTLMDSWSYGNADGTHLFTILGKTPVSATDSRRRRIIYANDALDGLLACIHLKMQTAGQVWVAKGPGTGISGAGCFSSQVYTLSAQGFVALMTSQLAALRTAYGEARFDFLNVNKGFNPANFVFRAVPDVASNDAQPAAAIEAWRDALYLQDLSLGWKQLVAPTKLSAVSKNYHFSVNLMKTYGPTGKLSLQEFSIQNQTGLSAGGGYVDDTQILSFSDYVGSFDFSSFLPAFDNTYLNDLLTVSWTNNDLFRTPSTADPVSTVTGNNYHDETDFIIKGRGINIAFTRTYNSIASATSVNGALGFGWTHSYAMKLRSNDFGKLPNCETVAQCPENKNSKTSSITYTDERGGDHNYLVNESTFAVTSPQGEFESLVLDSPAAGQHTLTFRNGTKYFFQTVGSGNIKTSPDVTARLTRIADAWGNQLNFTYDGNGRLSTVVDNLGITGRTGLVFAYDTAGKLSTIKDWTNRTWTYVVNASGHLESYTSAQAPSSGATQTYSYATGTHNLQTLTKPLQRGGRSVATTFAYYQNGRTFNHVNALGVGETLDYDLYRKTTRVTDGKGQVRAYEYDNAGRLTKLTEPNGAILMFTNSATDGVRDTKRDGLGYLTQYSYRADKVFTGPSDTYGNVTRERDALSQDIDTTYGLYDQVSSVKDKRGTTTTVSFHASTDATCKVTGKPDVRSVSSLTTASGVVKTNVSLTSYCWNSDGTLKSQTDYLDPNNSARTRVSTPTYTDATHLNVDHVTATGWDNVSGSATITRSFTYDSLGRKKTETLQRRNTPTDPTLVNLTTSYTYDNMDRVTQIQDAVGNLFINRYDDNGQLWQVTHQYKKPDTSYEVRNVLTRTFDAADRVATETDAMNGKTTYQYDPAGNVIAIADAENHTAKFEYDELGRRTAKVDANGAREVTTYNLRGDVISVTNAMGETTGAQYDAIGRKTQMNDAHGYITNFSYDANGNLTCVVDANAQAGLQPKNSDLCTESRKYDELGRVILIRDALNGTIATTYDLLGHPLTQIDAEGRQYVWSYDGLGRRVAESDFMGNTTSYFPDEAGNVWKKTNRLAEVIETTYDKLNRPTGVLYKKDNSTETLSYDPAGTVHTVANASPSSTITYTMGYDNLNRMLSRADSRGKSLAFTYDKTSNILTKTTYQDSVTRYTYDGAKRLVNASNPDYLSVNYQYDAAGRLLSRVMSSGARSLYSYDAGGWLSSLQHVDNVGASVSNKSYTYDRLGHIATLTSAGVTTNYTVDALYRLTQVDAPGTANDEAFSYDHIGNRLTATRAGNAIGVAGSTTKYYVYFPATQSATPVGLNGAYTQTNNNRLKEVHIGSVAGTLDSSFVFDNEGRLTAQSGAGARSITWDAKGRVASLISGGSTENYAYDPLNHRIKRSGGLVGNLDYYLEGDNIESTYSGGQLQEKYFRGGSIDELVAGYIYQSGALAPFIFQHDHIMSVSAATKPNGGVQESFTFWAFGEVQASGGTQVSRLKYTGREDDGTGLYQYRARYYDPSVGRFISEDPKGFTAGINLYVYCNNDPIDANDPSGLHENTFTFYLGQTDMNASQIVEKIGQNINNVFPLGAKLISGNASQPFMVGNVYELFPGNLGIPGNVIRVAASGGDERTSYYVFQTTDHHMLEGQAAHIIHVENGSAYYEELGSGPRGGVPALANNAIAAVMWDQKAKNIRNEIIDEPKSMGDTFWDLMWDPVRQLSEPVVSRADFSVLQNQGLSLGGAGGEGYLLYPSLSFMGVANGVYIKP